MIMLTEYILLIFAVYWLIIEMLRVKGKLEKWKITAYGPILLIRTEKGLNFLKRLALKKKFWKIYATTGIPLIYAGMIFMFLLIILMDYILLTTPPPPSEITSPRNVLLIPGINRFIPLVWGVVGLLVTLVVHEFSHAVLALSEKIKVKSLGVILALIPIGGFAEPDEKQLLQEAKTLSRMRVFAAGITSNFVVAAISFLIFFHLLSYITPAIAILSDSNGLIQPGTKIVEINGYAVKTPEDLEKALLKSEKVVMKLEDGRTIELNGITGIEIIDVSKGLPAEKAGLKKGMIILKVNGERVVTLHSFMNILKGKKANETVTLTVWDKGEIREVSLKLTEKNGRAIMGVLVQENISGVVFSYYLANKILSTLRSIPTMLTNPAGWIFVMALPITSFNSFSGIYVKMFNAKFGDATFYILNLFYWVGWINFYVGLFNCLPAIPLDGGRIFQDTVRVIFGKRISDNAVKLASALIFTSIFLSFIIPNLKGII